jgi:hypothetical protein
VVTRELTRCDGLFDVVVHAERSTGMEVATQPEGLHHGDAACHVRQQPQLQLPVIRHNERLPLFHICSERLPHLHNGVLMSVKPFSRTQCATRC